MPISEAEFGECDDLKAKLFTLTNAGVSVSVTDYGATLVNLLLPGRDGSIADCLLGFDNLAGYRRADNPYFGATIGRVANRIGRDATFSIDGEKYTVTANHNDGTAMLHGGNRGFDKVIWDSAVVEMPGRSTVFFTSVSPDGEEGFPGECRTVVSYSLSDKGELRIDMESTVDKATPVNLCNHAYFNLKGHGSGDVLGHKAHIKAAQFTPSGGDSIPTGELASVLGTPYDFSASGDGMRTIGEKIGEMAAVPGAGGGYDHNYVLTIAGSGFGKLAHAATVLEPESGRQLDLWTSAPGMQLYTANWLPPGPNGGDPTPIPGKAGQQYSRYGAFCLETQHFPDSPNKPNFPSTIIRPGEVYRHSMLFRFSVV